MDYSHEGQMASTGTALRNSRLKNGLSQAELGKRLAVTQVTVSNWENGKSRISPEALSKVEGILGPLSGRAGEDAASASVTPVGAWLSKVRARKGWTPAQLAEKANVSIPTVYNIESGRSQFPRRSTLSRLQEVLGESLDQDAQQQLGEEAEIKGLGEMEDFDPHTETDWPDGPGVYVFYDVSNRPIYVGKSGDIRRRIREHQDRFWFKRPIVDSASYVKIADRTLRTQVESVLIKFLKDNAVINKQQVDREE